MSKASIILCAIVSVVVSGCGGSASTTKRDDLAYLYGKDASVFRLSARVYHESAARSVIYFKLNTADLLYKSDGGGEPYVASVRISIPRRNGWCHTKSAPAHMAWTPGSPPT